MKKRKEEGVKATKEKRKGFEKRKRKKKDEKKGEHGRTK